MANDRTEQFTATPVATLRGGPYTAGYLALLQFDRPNLIPTGGPFQLLLSQTMQTSSPQLIMVGGPSGPGRDMLIPSPSADEQLIPTREAYV